MIKNGQKSDKDDLRKRAEEMARIQPEHLDRLSPAEVRSLIQELQVHQIELELQNEELRNTQKALEDARNRYFRLYHNAPMGYVVLDSAGIIRQANATFVRMINSDGVTLPGRAFADLLAGEDTRLFRARFRAFLKSPSDKSMVVQLATGDDAPSFIKLETVAFPGSQPAPIGHTDELLIAVANITEQKEAEISLKAALALSRFREKEVRALLSGARSVLTQSDFATTARQIFDACRELIGAASGYVALLSEDGAENELLFLESGGLPCDVDPELPMPIRGLRAEAYQSNRVVYHNDFMKSRWVRFMPKGHVNLKNVMFAPLVLGGKTVGIIGLANKATDFKENDVKLAAGFGELAAIALQNSRNLDQRDKAQSAREKVIGDLQKALAEVKQLSGLLPICSHCKKIRDDKGYWNQIEAYIQEHSEAQFSHSICRECAEKLYPELDLFGE